MISIKAPFTKCLFGGFSCLFGISPKRNCGEGYSDILLHIITAVSLRTMLFYLIPPYRIYEALCLAKLLRSF